MSLDLQEATRREDVFNQLLDINDRITKLGVFPSLGWVWCFDVIRDIVDNNHQDDMAVGDIMDEVVPTGVTLQQVFNKFYEDIDSLGMNMDLGGEIIEEVIRDWMRENDFIVALDDDGWLDD
jgi:hypothetical protein